MRDTRPVSRCSVRACPMIGYWPDGGRCPQHRHPDYDPPTLAEQVEQ